MNPLESVVSQRRGEFNEFLPRAILKGKRGLQVGWINGTAGSAEDVAFFPWTVRPGWSEIAERSCPQYLQGIMKQDPKELI